MLQAKQSRGDQQQQEQSSPNLGRTCLLADSMGLHKKAVHRLCEQHFPFSFDAAAAELTLTLAAGHIFPGKFPWRKVLHYMLAQFLGAFAGAALVYGVYFEALREAEAEVEVLKTKVATSEEQCGHLVRLGEQRHQEILSLETQLKAMEDKAKEMLLAQV